MSYLEYLENLASNFDITKDSQVYQKEQLFKFNDRNIDKDNDKENIDDKNDEKNEDKENDNNENKDEKEKEDKNIEKDKKRKIKDKNKFYINFRRCHVAICPNGGLIAICKKQGYLDLTKGSKINKNIIVMHQTTFKNYYIPIDWPYLKQYFILFDFNEKEQLYGICNDAAIYKIDILTQRAIPKLTSELLKQEKINKAQFYKEGFIALTEEGKIYYVKEIKNVIPDLVIDMRLILKFSNKIEFLVIPEDISQSKTIELLITNEKENGIIHIEKSEDGLYYIVPIDTKNSKTSIVGYKNISLLKKDKLEPYLLEDTNTNIKNKNKNTKKSKESQSQNLHENLGKILAMAISPSKKNIALYDSRGIIFFFSSSFDPNSERNPRIKTEINLSSELTGNDMVEQQMVVNFSKEFQFLFCGEDAVVLYGLRLIILVNKKSEVVLYKITEEDEEEALRGKLFAKLIQEIDGIRYITNEGIFFISKVNKDLFSICDPFSNSSSKKLLKAYINYEDNSPSSEKTLREINNYLPKAVNSLQIAAGNIFWNDHSEDEDNYEKKELQLFLLKAAQFGKIYLNETEFNYDKFVEICKDIKCVNNLRNHLKFPRLITFNEYKNMESKDLIKKLMRNLNFGMAFEICHFLDYSDKKVYQRFAISKIKKISKNINRDEEENLANALIEKLKNVPNLSFIKLAQKAFKYHKRIIGEKFLENEKSVLSKLPQYIELKDWKKVLELVENMYDWNVINTVLHKIYEKEGLKNFIGIVSESPNIKSAVVDFLKKRNPDYVEQFLIEMKNEEEKFHYFLEKFFGLSDLKERKIYLNKAKDCIKLIDSSKYPNFEQKFYKNYIESLENSIKFKTSKENKNVILEKNEDVSFDISIYDTYKLIIKEIKEDKNNNIEKYKDKTFNFSQEGMTIMKLMMLGENNRFIEMELLVKKYNNNLKKLGLTNLNVTEIFFKFKRYDKAIEYLKNITEPAYLNHKINLLEFTENYELELEMIFADKKITNLGDLVNMILAKKPNLRNKVDELCERYKIKMEFN